MKITDKLTITNEDNMTLMARYPDNYFELAIVDPPYGNVAVFQNCQPLQRKNERPKKYANKDWDKQKPTVEYWEQLFRVSQNQIVWGGNYFTSFLPESKGWVYWDKNNGENNFSDGELAWTSFEKRLMSYKKNSKAETRGGKDRFHPTQKPKSLYKWLLDKYAKDGDKILDTHLGSGSIALACHDYGFELTACELDTEYYEKAVERIKNHVAQQKLF